MPKTPTIGIDLGTTYSCVAVYRNGKVEIIANDQGNRTTPSYVSFKGAERIVGEAAKVLAGSNTPNTVFDIKRIIGRKYADEYVQSDKMNWPFEIIDSDGDPKIQITEKNELKEFLPQQISAMVLMKMKQIAESYLGAKVEDAVITVPAYFNNSQRQATIDAGKIAGLNVKRIINEPTAAAMAYGSDMKIRDKQNILVFDLGGGTFDVSIVNIVDNNFEVIAVGGDTHLGGIDFDNRMVTYFIEEIKESYKTDISNNKRCLRRLRTKCEEAKRYLSSCVETPIDIEVLFDGIDYSSKINRAAFNNLNNDMYNRILETMRNVLKSAKLDKENIDEIVLVGGSTKILQIQNLIKKFFGGKELNMSINPDEAVAYGAAIQGAMLDGCFKFKDMVLSDVTALSLGVGAEGGIMSVIIERNTRIPVRKTERFETCEDNQTDLTIEVYEGERPMISDNHLLATFHLEGILPLPRGVAKIDETFEIDVNGVLTVTAVENTAGNQKQITISKNKSQLSQDVVDGMIQEAKEYKKNDEKRHESTVAKNELDHLCCDVKSAVQNMDNENISSENKLSIISYCDELIKKLKTLELKEESFYKLKKNDLEKKISEYKINIEK